MSEKKKVRFIKNHVNGIKKGDVESYDIGRADYLVRVNAAEYVIDEPNKEDKKQTAKAADKKSKNKGEEPCKTC